MATKYLDEAVYDSIELNKTILDEDIPIDQKYYVLLHRHGYRECKYLNNPAKRILIKVSWLQDTHPEAIPCFDPLPPKIKVRDTFLDWNIDIRGNCNNIDSVYFKISDLVKASEITYIQDMFDKDNHYKIFSQKESKVEYFTYWGVIKYLQGNMKILREFHHWSNEEFDNSNNPMGIPRNILQSFIKTTVEPLSVIYLFTLGKVSDLTQDFKNSLELSNYDPDDIIIKYGLTNNLERRANEHRTYYGKKYGCNVMLLFWTCIDEDMLKSAEDDIENYFKSLNVHLNHKTFTELCCIPKSLLDTQVRIRYQLLHGMYFMNMKKMKIDIEHKDNLRTFLEKELSTLQTVIEKERELNKVKTSESLIIKEQLDLYKKMIETRPIITRRKPLFSRIFS